MGGTDARVLSHLFPFFFFSSSFFFRVNFEIDCGFGRVFGCGVSRGFVWFCFDFVALSCSAGSGRG